jgi:hypothetical protein
MQIVKSGIQCSHDNPIRLNVMLLMARGGILGGGESPPSRDKTEANLCPFQALSEGARTSPGVSQDLFALAGRETFADGERACSR